MAVDGLTRHLEHDVLEMTLCEQLELVSVEVIHLSLHWSLRFHQELGKLEDLVSRLDGHGLIQVAH